ncbi:sulfatase-like hydrolase/transferase [Paraglaciecola aquimarina]|uniref:Sulfatase-like hydrolase/transferase n=1 Tax=Paraglaciecola aquimarina TaxID=1235557 RepID=A0ABU3SRW6_9ALTE|nr:sulfatase-like hydrolase/transferase [Paraglaciecola aquimarina]MDU0352731.1 sulfatase-like hydrolase/transferase [Paraglaciecola aquimarina]
MSLIKRVFSIVTIAVLGTANCFNAIAQSKQDSTNVVLILIDDISHYGVTAYGADRINSYRKRFKDVKISTPNIDKLAEQGVMVDNAFAYQLCENTRIAIMSGKENKRNYLQPKSQHHSDITFGDTFQKAGYKTGLFGKWKQTRGTKSIHAKDYIFEFGWDEFTAFDVVGAKNRFINPDLVVNGKVTNYNNRKDVDPITGRRWYGPDIVNRDALNFIERNKDNPFFLYYPMMLIHDKHQPTPDTLPHSVFDNFQENRVRNVAMEKSGDDHKYLPDMIAYMDKMIGNVVKKLDETGLREKTLIVVVGDNGTKETFEHVFADGTRYPGRKGGHADNGLHVPLILNQPKTIPAGLGKKENNYQGMVDIVDIYPTIAEAANVTIPNQQDIDGISFWQQAKGAKGEARTTIHHWGNGNNKYTDNHMIVDYAFNQHFKRYAPTQHFPKGRFFDLRTDLLERAGDTFKEFKFKVLRYSGLPVESLDAEQKAAYDMLGEVLKQNRIVEIEDIAIMSAPSKLKVGQMSQLHAKLTPANTTRNGVVWVSSDPSVVSVNKFGEVVAHKVGKANIQVYSWADAKPLANNQAPEFLTTGVSDSHIFTVN